MRKVFKQSQSHPRAQTENSRFLILLNQYLLEKSHSTWYVIIFDAKGSMDNLNWHLLFITQIIVLLDGLLKASTS